MSSRKERRERQQDESRRRSRRRPADLQARRRGSPTKRRPLADRTSTINKVLSLALGTVVFIAAYLVIKHLL